jgi:serine/threonine-protein kinase
VTLGLDWVRAQFVDLTNLEPLGRGGQKTVLSAKHPGDGDVVLKFILPGQDVERVRREIVAVQRVGSRRVPAIHEVGVVGSPFGNYIWLREQRVMGQTLREVLAAGALPLRQVKDLALHMLEALADAERVQIVHRDVKPENIMAGSDGRFWLLDFGYARHLTLESLTETAALGGPCTPGYSPPEQFRNRKREVDARADLFALAVTVVEALTRRNQYRDGARDIADILRRIEAAPLVVPLLPQDAGFHDLVATMGQSRIDCRPRTAADALKWMTELV